MMVFFGDQIDINFRTRQKVYFEKIKRKKNNFNSLMRQFLEKTNVNNSHNSVGDSNIKRDCFFFFFFEK